MTKPRYATLLLVLAAPLARAQDPPVPSVTVTARKEAVVKKIDRTVYDVSNAPRAANGSAQDVLQATPELAVTADGRIAVKGNTQVTVLVDGRPTAQLSGSDEDRAVALQTMSGADIASVEVITNPSAAQNANGGAIVNIVLKRNRKPGEHAQVRASATDQALWNAGASGDVTRGGLSVHGNVAVRHDGTRKIRRSAVDWNNPLTGQEGQTVQSSEVFVRRVVDSAALGVDYALGDTDSVSFSARHARRRSRPLFDVLGEERTGDDETIHHRISYGPNEQSDDSASLTYSRQWNGTALKASLQHSTTDTLVDKSYRDVFVVPARATAYSRGAGTSARRFDQATVDWTLAQWGLGLDIRHKTDAIGNYQAAVDPATGAEAPDRNTTNAYTVTMTSAAAYVTDRIVLGKWETLLGARAGRTARWRTFDPSLHVKYALRDGTDVTLGYRRSLQLPDPRDLGPFTTYVDAQNVSRGNPNLGPQRLASWEIGVNKEMPHLTGSAGVFYRASRDPVIDTRTFEDNVLVTSKRNGGQARTLGITGALDWKPDEPLHLGVDGGVYRVALGRDAVSGYVNVRAGYGDVSLDAHAQSAGITPLGRYGPTSSVNLVWKHGIDKTLDLTVNADDIFDGSRRAYRTDTPTFRQAGFDHFVARRVWVGVVKRFSR
ncbi:Outer membrane receptor proteins, mostly Fe transport [Massilia sp. PDC64]|nr:TonB-dependent receptor [Massilia sp. PDC64]SDD09414.1 Outer membrane receptor proteins, mostly Fe transport [Massilia sp. PDC64]